MKKFNNLNDFESKKTQIETRLSNLQHKLNPKKQKKQKNQQPQQYGIPENQKQQIRNNINSMYSLLLQKKQLRLKQQQLNNNQISNTKSIVNQLLQNTPDSHDTYHRQSLPLPQFGGQTDRQQKKSAKQVKTSKQQTDTKQIPEVKRQLKYNTSAKNSTRKHQLLRTGGKSSTTKINDSNQKLNQQHTPGLIKSSAKKGQKQSQKYINYENQTFQGNGNRFLFKNNQNVVNTFSEFKQNNIQKIGSDFTNERRSNLKNNKLIPSQTPYKALLDNVNIKPNIINRNQISLQNDSQLLEKYTQKKYPRWEQEFARQRRQINSMIGRSTAVRQRDLIRQMQKQKTLQRLIQIQRIQKIKQDMYLQEQQLRLKDKIKRDRIYSNYPEQTGRRITPTKYTYQDKYYRDQLLPRQNDQSLLQKYTRGERARQYQQILAFVQKQNHLKNSIHRSNQRQTQILNNYQKQMRSNRLEDQIQEIKFIRKRPHYQQNLLRRRNLSTHNLGSDYRKKNINQITYNYYQPNVQIKQKISNKQSQLKQYTQQQQTENKSQRSPQKNFSILNNQKLPASKKRLKFDEQYKKSIIESGNKRIQARLSHSWALYEDSNFRNNKHQRQHLINTYEKQSKLRKQIQQKILGQGSVTKKYGLLKAFVN